MRADVRACVCAYLCACMRACVAGSRTFKDRREAGDAALQRVQVSGRGHSGRGVQDGALAAGGLLGGARQVPLASGSEPPEGSGQRHGELGGWEGTVAPIPDGDTSRLSRVQGEEGGAAVAFTQTEPCGATPAGRGGGRLAGCGVTWRWTALRLTHMAVQILS